jgi:hypothetical protein
MKRRACEISIPENMTTKFYSEGEWNMRWRIDGFTEV